MKPRMFIGSTYFIILSVIIVLSLGCSDSSDSIMGPSIDVGPAFPLDTTPSDIAWDGQNIWTILYGVIYQISTNGEIISSFPAPNDSCFTIEWDSNYLWTIEAQPGPGFITPEPPYNIYRLTTSGEIVTSFVSPVGNGYLVWDGQALWIGSRPEWHRISVTSEYLSSFTTDNGNRTYGAAWDGQNICCVISASRGDFYVEFYKLNTQGETVYTHRFPYKAGDPQRRLMCLAYDNGDFWTIAEWPSGQYQTERRITKITGLN